MTTAAAVTLLLLLLLTVLSLTIEAKINPTCGIGCYYVENDAFGFNCEAQVFYQGSAYAYVSYQFACSDKSCPANYEQCKVFDGPNECKVGDSSNTLLETFVCETPTGLVVKQGTKENTHTAEYWFYYTFAKKAVEAPPGSSWGGYAVLFAVLGCGAGVGLTILGFYVRRKRAEATFQR